MKKAVTVGWAMTGGQDRAAVVRRVVLTAACRSTRLRELLAAPSSPRLKTGALQDVGRRARVPRTLRIGGLIGNPVVTADDGSARLDDVLCRRTAVLTGARPESGLVEFCRRHDFLLVRLVPARAGNGGRTGAGMHRVDAVRDGWEQAAVADADGCGLAALLSDPALAVVVRPDRVVAAVARRPHLPTLPWPVRTVPTAAPTVATA